MAYGVQFLGQFINPAGLEYQVLLRKKDTATSSVNIPFLSDDPLRYSLRGDEKNADKIVFGSEVLFSFETSDPSIYSDIFESTYKEWQLEVRKRINSVWQRIWIGYVQPENLSRSFHDNSYTIDISATDALKDLSESEYRDQNGDLYFGRVAIIEAIRNALSPLELNLDFSVLLNVYETSQGAEGFALLNRVDSRVFIDVDSERPKSCLEVIEILLEPFNCTIKQINGSYRIRSRSETTGPVFASTFGNPTSVIISSSVSTEVDIQNYDFYYGGSLSKESPVKHILVTHRNRNLGESLVPNLDNFNEVTGPWIIGDGFPVVTNINGGANLDTSYLETDNRYITLKNDISITPYGEKDYFIISFNYKIRNFNDLFLARDNRIEIIVSIIKPGGEEEVVAVRNKKEGVYDSSIAAFMPAMLIPETGVYNIKISLNVDLDPADNPEWNVDFTLTNIDITRVSVDGNNVETDLSFDREFRGTRVNGKRRVEKEFFIADTIQNNDIGAIYKESSEANTALWVEPGGPTSRPLVRMYIAQYFRRRNKYSSYISLTCIDPGDTINPDSVIGFTYEGNIRKFDIIRYTRSCITNELRLTLFELSTEAVVEYEISEEQQETIGAQFPIIDDLPALELQLAHEILHDIDSEDDHAPAAEADKGKYVRANPDTGAIEFIDPELGEQHDRQHNIDSEDDHAPVALVQDRGSLVHANETTGKVEWTKTINGGIFQP